MTSNPSSRSARAMILAPRSWPSRPGFATRILIFRLSAIFLQKRDELFRLRDGLVRESPEREPGVPRQAGQLTGRIISDDESGRKRLLARPLEALRHPVDSTV